MLIELTALPDDWDDIETQIVVLNRRIAARAECHWQT